MKITHSADVPFEERVGGRATAGQARTRIKLLHEAGADDPPGFEMVVARYPAPRDYPEHRHTIDQVRLTLSGLSPWGPGRETPEGGIVYIPAGTPYGPYVRPAGIELMAVQFQGLAEHPFGGEADSQHGPFPPPRTPIPIELNPEAVGWTSTAPGVHERRMVVFGPNDVGISQVRLEQGGRWTLSARQRTLVFVTAGQGRAGDETLERWDAIRLEPAEAVDLAGAASVDLFVLGLARLAG